MARVRFLRILAVILFALLVLGPLAGSLRSAPGALRLTGTNDVDSFRWTPGGDLLFARPSRSIRLSPGRSQVIYDLYRIASTGGPTMQVASNANLPALSPDGKQVVYLVLNDDGTARLNLLDLATGNARDLGAADWGSGPQWVGAGRVLSRVQGSVVAVDVATGSRNPTASQPLPRDYNTSPRGDHIAFIASDGLHILSNGVDKRAFTAPPSASLLHTLRWSHDGTHLAFLVTQDGVNPELWVVSANGTAALPLYRGQMEYLAGIDWSPDDSNLVLTRTPTGSSVSAASEVWRVWLTGRAERLTDNQLEETTPRYSPDGARIAFLRDGNLWVAPLGPNGLVADSSQPTAAAQRNDPEPIVPTAPRHSPAAIWDPRSPVSLLTASNLTPPATIRVKHDGTNNLCRIEPDGQIDIFPFETYVKQVVPAEMPPSWQGEALKTQAVAARSYAWFWVLRHTGQDWDVLDSTLYQYMCDKRYATSDAATDATSGQYGDYGGQVIFAAYGANNGDPTVHPTWNNSYLLSVDDPVDFGNAVSGNGYGMSQVGAQRWAAPPYNWSYQQILMHYYTNITVEAAAGTTPDTTPPIGGMVAPWSNWGVVSNQLFLQASASDDASSVSQVALNAQYTSGGVPQSVTLYPSYDGNYWNQRADLRTIPDQSGIVVTPRIKDGSGNIFQGNGISFTLDRGLPTGTVSGPASTNDLNVTLSLSATDTGPSGLRGMAFSNNWVWQGENQYVTNGSGAVVNDPAALDGLALMGQKGVNPAGTWYGPYTTILPPAKYRAYFRLKTDDDTTTSEVALLDVVDNNGTTLLGLKRLRGTDFAASNAYQEFYVDFDYTNPGSPAPPLEFRVAFRATASLWLDRIIVVSYPIQYTGSAQWQLSPGIGAKKVRAKFIDGAGNVSADATTVIQYGSTPTATSTPTITLPPTMTPTATVTATPTATPVLFPEIWLPGLGQ